MKRSQPLAKQNLVVSGNWQGTSSTSSTSPWLKLSPQLQNEWRNSHAPLISASNYLWTHFTTANVIVIDSSYWPASRLTLKHMCTRRSCEREIERRSHLQKTPSHRIALLFVARARDSKVSLGAGWQPVVTSRLLYYCQYFFFHDKTLKHLLNAFSRRASEIHQCTVQTLNGVNLSQSDIPVKKRFRLMGTFINI